MTPLEIIRRRHEVLDRMQAITDAYDDYIEAIEPLELLDEKGSLNLYDGLSEEDAADLRDVIHAHAAAYLVSALWYNDRRSSGGQRSREHIEFERKLRDLDPHAPMIIDKLRRLSGQVMAGEKERLRRERRR